MTLDKYYSDNCTRLVLQLAKKIGNLEEAEDRVQNVFMSLFARKEFCEDLIAKKEFDKYVQGAINRQPAQVLREQYRQVPTVSIDSDNIDFLSSIRHNDNDWGLCERELKDFYEAAVECLAGGRKLPSGSFNTVGELRQYIFIQYCQNGRTFQEIGELVGLSLQNISLHFARIVTILTPMIEAFIGRKLNSKGNDLNIIGD